MANITFHSTYLAVQALEKILKSRLSLEGLEHLQDSPSLFVVNHFTRAETFIIPCAIFKHTGKQVNSLADPKLFKGQFGQYLKKIGAVSTHEPSRNRRIIGDLLTGRQNWVIYPEGVMVKTKKIIKKGRFIISEPHRVGPPHTGAAMLALYSEIYKRYYRHSQETNHLKDLKRYRKMFFFSEQDIVSSRETVIIPINITFYPIRPGKNVLKHLVKKFFRSLPSRIEEELEIEGNILLSETDINIFFGRPIYATEYLGRLFGLTKFLPSVIRQKRWVHFLFWGNLKKLTRKFMEEIYTKVSINIDHVFCTALYLCAKKSKRKDDFLGAVYLSSSNISKRGYRAHSTISQNAIRIICDEPWEPLDDIIKLAKSFLAFDELDEDWIINTARLEKKHIFHKIRTENTLQVIANELEPLKDVLAIIKRNINTSSIKLRKQIVEDVCETDLAYFDKDYKKHYEEGVSKPRNIGMPFFLKCRSSRIGIVLSHGYMAAPEEIRLLAEHLYLKGYSVYGVRLRGHGTSSADLADILWEDWELSYSRGYAAIKNSCEEIILGGFSAGGILALLSGAKKKSPKIRGVFLINAPIRLIRTESKYIPALNLWNDMLDRFHLEGMQSNPYVENTPENPLINYTKNPLKGVEQLMNMMNESAKHLEHITSPALIIQSGDDPVVHPESARVIYDGISSVDKTLKYLPFDRHGILRGEGKEKVFALVGEFIRRVC